MVNTELLKVQMVFSCCNFTYASSLPVLIQCRSQYFRPGIRIAFIVFRKILRGQITIGKHGPVKSIATVNQVAAFLIPHFKFAYLPMTHEPSNPIGKFLMGRRPPCHSEKINTVVQMVEVAFKKIPGC